ncbi:MAG: hypothetical protein IKS42_05585 [Oscillospiraceae bacterium]|nr:hypothetical protein [Oscillospiraceae bacterium]
MIYHEALNQILKQYHITAKSLSEASGISPASLSRCRQGAKLPDPQKAAAITESILALIAAHGIELSPSRTEELREMLATQKTVFLWARFDTLLKTMQIPLKDLAEYVQFMPSYLSKIRTGKRSPGDPERFVRGISRYLTEMRSGAADLGILHGLTGCTGKEDLAYTTERWLLGNSAETPAKMLQFLRRLDGFDLNEYLTAARFDALEVPAVQPVPPLHTDYYGLERIRQSHLDFFRLTAQSESAAPVFMHADLPITDLAEDRAWITEWMRSIAVCLKKGLTLRVVHNVDRPLDEMHIGLEAWIPLYMTGQIEPYYFPETSAAVYSHVNFISGAAYLCAEGADGAPADTWHELDTTQIKVEAAQRKAAALLMKAQPLMEIYTASKAVLYQQTLTQRIKEKGALMILHPSLPLHSMPEGMLAEILRRNDVPRTQAERILAFAAVQQKGFLRALTADPVTEVIPELTEAQFTVHPLRLCLSDCFCELPLTYTYAEYCRHLEALRDLRHPRYRLLLREEPVFRSMQLSVKEGKWAVFSKTNSPVTHFVIRHPKMLSAVQSFVRSVLTGEA